jgi:hypothetical protein
MYQRAWWTTLTILALAPGVSWAAESCVQAACHIQLAEGRSTGRLEAQGMLPTVYPGDIITAEVTGEDPRVIGTWSCKKESGFWIWSKTKHWTKKFPGKLGESVHIFLDAPGLSQRWELAAREEQRVVSGHNQIEITGNYRLEKPGGDCSEESYFPEKYVVRVQIERTHP